VAVPARGGLPLRRLGPLPASAAMWWFLGCHGGAGSSTLTTAVGRGSMDAGRYWPVPDSPGVTNVVLVARSHAHGLRAAQTAVSQWASGQVPAVRLLGLAVVADAPGKRPRPLRELLELVSGAFPRVWDLPWVEALRLGDPADQTALPESFSALAIDLHELITGASRRK
jgi:hypothetical protein